MLDKSLLNINVWRWAHSPDDMYARANSTAVAAEVRWQYVKTHQVVEATHVGVAISAVRLEVRRELAHTCTRNH